MARSDASSGELCPRCCKYTLPCTCEEEAGRRARKDRAGAAIVFKTATSGPVRPGRVDGQEEEGPGTTCPKCGFVRDHDGSCQCDAPDGKDRAHPRRLLPNRGGGAPPASTPSASTSGAPPVQAKGVVPIGPVAVRSLDDVAADLIPHVVGSLAKGLVGAFVGGLALATAQAVDAVKRSRGR